MMWYTSCLDGGMVPLKILEWSGLVPSIDCVMMTSRDGNSCFYYMIISERRDKIITAEFFNLGVQIHPLPVGI
jgi:hypothetical protein